MDILERLTMEVSGATKLLYPMYETGVKRKGSGAYDSPLRPGCALEPLQSLGSSGGFRGGGTVARAPPRLNKEYTR